MRTRPVLIELALMLGLLLALGALALLEARL